MGRPRTKTIKRRNKIQTQWAVFLFIIFLDKVHLTNSTVLIQESGGQ